MGLKPPCTAGTVHRHDMKADCSALRAPAIAACIRIPGYCLHDPAGGRQMWQDNNDKIMDILDNIEASKIKYFPVVCPICTKKDVHLYCM